MGQIQFWEPVIKFVFKCRCISKLKLVNYLRKKEDSGINNNRKKGGLSQNLNKTFLMTACRTGEQERRLPPEYWHQMVLFPP